MEKLLDRKQLSERWNCSTRKIDRLRSFGLLDWIDISGGIGSRPTVRFHIDAIQEFENQNLKSIGTTPTA